MRDLKINRDKYQELLINMVYSLVAKKRNTHTLVISKLVDMAYNGMINRAEFRKVAVTELKMSEDLIRKTIFKLKLQGHISIIGSTIYINPIYKAVKECEGMFLITPK